MRHFSSERLKRTQRLTVPSATLFVLPTGLFPVSPFCTALLTLGRDLTFIQFKRLSRAGWAHPRNGCIKSPAGQRQPPTSCPL